MADLNLEVFDAKFYDPDGPNTPINFIVPLSTGVPDGSRFILSNKNTSETPVTLTCQGSDTVNHPDDLTSFLAAQSIAIPEAMLQYMLVGSTWRICSSNLNFKYIDKISALQIFSFAAYGGLQLSTPWTGAASLDDLWAAVSVFDQIQFATPRGVVQNLTNDTLLFENEGVYQHNIILNYTHDELPQSRQTQIRLYNLTDTTGPTTGIVIPVSRNQPSTLISLSFLQEITSATKNKEFRLELGNGDDITISAIPGADWSVAAVSEWREPLV